MTRLRSDEALNHFNTALDEKVGPVDVESPVIETAWNSLQEAINVACKESIGHARRVNRDSFKDIIKHNIKAFGTTTNTWEQAAMDRSKYCAFLHSGAMLAEATRAERVKEKRRRRKDRTSPEAGVPALTCPHCDHQFTAQIGLFTT